MRDMPPEPPPLPPLPKELPPPADLIKLFPATRWLPGERILQDYACAWNKEVLLQGRLYLHFTDLIDLSKRSLALVIPNSIQIETFDAKYFLASFFTRDEVFDFISHLWNQHVDPQSLWRRYPTRLSLPCVCDLDQTECDVCLAKARIKQVDPLLKQTLAKKFLPKPEDGFIMRAVTDGGGSAVADSSISGHKSSPTLIPKHPRDASQESTTSTLSETCNCAPLDSAKVLIDVDLPIPMSTLVSHMHFLSEPLGGWYLEFCQQRGITGEISFLIFCLDIKVGPWVSSSAQSIPIPVSQIQSHSPPNTLEQGSHRTIEYVMPLNAAWGPKSTLCLIHQTVESHVEGSNLCILMKTETPLVPYGTTFYSQGRVCICQKKGGSSRCWVSYRVVFTKPNLLKGAVLASFIQQARFNVARRRAPNSFILSLWIL